MVLALSPATLRKAGSGFDLALACGVLAAAGTVAQRALDGTVLVGELALDGRLRAVRGVLPCLLAARAAGMRRVVVPEATLPEAALVDGLEVHGAATLGQVLAWLEGAQVLARPGPPPAPPDAAIHDLADVVGQDDARRALEVAAAGGHHLLLVGPPGTGKTMLAQRIVGLLPELSSDDALALAAIRSVAGRLPAEGLTRVPPFMAPHHSTSMAALVGGGSGLAKPGAVSLAHRGTLFMDEAPEFESHVARRAAHPAGRGRGPARPGRRHRVLPGPVPARARGQPVPVRARARPRLRVPVAGAPPLPRAAVRAAARPRRPACPDVPVTALSAVREPAEDTATVRARVLAARAAAAERWAGTAGGATRRCPAPRCAPGSRCPRRSCGRWTPVCAAAS